MKTEKTVLLGDGGGSQVCQLGERSSCPVREFYVENLLVRFRH